MTNSVTARISVIRRAEQRRAALRNAAVGAATSVTVNFEEKPVYLNIYRDKVWITQEGDIVPLDQMTTSHLKNCIRLMERESMISSWRKPIFYAPMIEELKRRESQPAKLKGRRIRTRPNEDNPVGIETQASEDSAK